jgi:hypothetical protein
MASAKWARQAASSGSVLANCPLTPLRARLGIPVTYLHRRIGKFRIKGETGKADKRGSRLQFPNPARPEQPA